MPARECHPRGGGAPRGLVVRRRYQAAPSPDGRLFVWVGNCAPSARILCDVMGSRLELTRSQILGFRRSVGALDQRLAPGAPSLRRAAWAGLQDSMPPAALLSIHARVEETHASTWEDPSLVQLWGPRHSVFVVAARDRGVFTLGTLPEAGNGRRRAEEMAARLQSFSGGAPR